MRRREFIALLGSTAAWSVAARAQPADRLRRIGVLIGLAADDPQGKAIIAAFLQGLQQFGWSDGRNVKIDIRWGAGNADDMRKYAAELVALTPDVMLATEPSKVLRSRVKASFSARNQLDAGFHATLWPM